jgi:hypothetical protein
MRWTIITLSLTAIQTSAQISCYDLPIDYDPSTATFVESEFSLGDSVLHVDVRNESMASYAYPQLKLVPIIPLPPGMTMTSDWSVFASAWNPGDTATADIYFDVAQPIPPGAVVTFEVWAKNLSPLLEDDSCRFDQDLTMNLDPVAQGIAYFSAGIPMKSWPLPTNDELTVEFPEIGTSDQLELWSMAGVLVCRLNVSKPRMVVPVSSLTAGAYQLLWRREGRLLGRNVAVVLH